MSALRIITKEKSDFIILWDDFCARNEVSVFSSYLWIDFCVQILREKFLKDLSFMVMNDKSVVAIVPMLMEVGMYGKQFSVRNGYMLRAPTISIETEEDARNEIEKKIFSHIVEIALVENVRLYMTLIDPLSVIMQSSGYNFLLKHNFIDGSLLTTIVDLRMPVEKLFGRLRKSFKPLINRELKSCEVITVDHKNADRILFEHFPRLYYLASGRDVYTPLEWASLLKMIERDFGMLILIRLKNEIIGGSYFNHSGGKAYYSFSANDPAYETSNYIGHVAIWKAMEYYAQRGLGWLELGWQFFGPQLLENPSEKEISISFFKRGFGGTYFPVYRGIKFFDAETRKKFIENNLVI
jgi:hypothetical protein